MNPLIVNLLSLMAGVLLAMSSWATQVSEQEADNEYLCKLAGSADYFVLYQRQVSYEGTDFRHYTMLNGLTVIVLNKQSLRFNRLSNLALLSVSTLDINMPAEANQLMHGSCRLVS